MLGATFLHRSNMDPRSAEYSAFHQQHIKQEVLDRRLSSNSSYPSRSKSKIRGVKNSADPMSPSSYSSWGSSGRRPADHGSSGDEAFGVPQQYMNVSNSCLDKPYYLTHRK